MRKLVLGPVELYLLDDGTLDYPASAFFANVPAHVLRANAHPDAHGNIRVGHNCALVRTPHELILIDTGYGDDTHAGATGHLLDELARAGFRCDHVSMVVNTHAHGDHIKRNTVVVDGERVATFPNARYHLGKADWQWFGGARRRPEFDEQLALLDRVGALACVAPEFRLTREVLLLPTPGHTPGHTSVLIESAGQSVIFLGDVCHHPLHVAHPGWVSTFDTHPAQTPRTREALFARAAAADALVVFPHALAPGLGRIVESGGRYRWCEQR
jgi:glyoxylase-like metal-dependent hydrolase (beta-lactamase superfamily II)